ncbi:hypothetical protein B0H34DRAFT_708604 [Crassisporium funariophilum]|nr:hypothetical protein B0H34DRAFT_708604 [Crassisporium funariophilum]
MTCWHWLCSSLVLIICESFPRYLALLTQHHYSPLDQHRPIPRVLMSNITTAANHVTIKPLEQTISVKQPPIHELPPELLIEILSYCAVNEAFAPLTLRKVSRWWQAIVDTSPRLWQSITLEDGDKGMTLSKHQAALWTHRSQPLQYDVELNVNDADSILPLISRLLPSIERWRSCRLTGKGEEEVVMDDLEDLTPESLTHLHIILHDYAVAEFDDDDDALSKITFAPTCPGQTFSFAMNVWLSQVPAARLLSPLRFTHVTIKEGGQVGLHTQAECILDFLTACPELESFYLDGWLHLGSINGDLPEVYLPNLVMLHLKSTCSVRAILSSLNTPRLQYLYLEHLNVDFQLQGEYREEGDSDDEARDYSQSPWSDHATGMGLRRLISRCNPPIKLLEMNFCDMRTKDFRYVFDRLPLLEDFRIVASDMSDKVINLLRPIAQNSGDTSSTSMQLRLPQLQILKLVNCQRLSGKAIVDSLVERVKWTDMDDTDCTLVEVTIVGCEGFTPWDQHILSKTLRSRLKTEEVVYP